MLGLEEHRRPVTADDTVPRRNATGTVIAVKTSKATLAPSGHLKRYTRHRNQPNFTSKRLFVEAAHNAVDSIKVAAVSMQADRHSIKAAIPVARLIDGPEY
jgi:ribosomal protein L28